LETYFPEEFQNQEQQKQNILKLRMINASCDGIIEDKDVDQEVYEIEKELLQGVKPNIWNVHIEGNLEQKIEVDSQVYSTSVIENLNLNLETITVFDFYASVKYLKSKNEKK
jgi:hypothetical protein